MFNLEKLFSQSYFEVLNRRKIVYPKGDFDSDTMYDFFNELLRMYNFLSYYDDEQSVYDQMIINAMLEILDEYDFG